MALADDEFDWFAGLAGDLVAVAIVTIGTTLVVTLAAYLLARAVRAWRCDRGLLPHFVRNAALSYLLVGGILHWINWRGRPGGVPGMGPADYVGAIALLLVPFLATAWALGAWIRRGTDTHRVAKRE